MMKRKVALLMTTVMLATSVFPSGITAYAEDAVLTGETAAEVTLDGTEEEPADVSSVDDDVDVPDEIAGTEADFAQTEGAVQEEDDELQQDEFVAEEIGVDETSQDAAAEEGEQPAPIVAEGDLIVSDVEVVDEASPMVNAAESAESFPWSGVTPTVLECNNTYQVNIKNKGDGQWFSFTSKDGGDYVFMSYSNEEEADPKVYYYIVNNGTIRYNDYNDDYGDEGLDFRVSVSLDPGETCYFNTTCYEDDDENSGTGSYQVRLYDKESLVPQSVEFDNTVTLTAHMDGLDSVPIKITYGEGVEPEVLKYGESSKYSGETIYCALDNEESGDMDENECFAKAKDYTLKVYTIGYGDEYEEDEIEKIIGTFSVSVRSLETASGSNKLASGQAYELTDRVSYMKFTTDGTESSDKVPYVFRLSGDIELESITIVSEDGSFISRIIDTSRNVQLNAGKTYYVAVKLYEGTSGEVTPSLTVEKAEKIKNVTLTTETREINASSVLYTGLPFVLTVEYQDSVDNEAFSSQDIQKTIGGKIVTRSGDTIDVTYKNESRIPNYQWCPIGMETLTATVEGADEKNSASLSFTIENDMIGATTMTAGTTYSAPGYYSNISAANYYKCPTPGSYYFDNSDIYIYCYKYEENDDTINQVGIYDSYESIDSSQVTYLLPICRGEEPTASFALKNVPTISAITLEKAPSKETYTLGNNGVYIGCEGMQIRVQYTDGSSKVMDVPEDADLEDLFGNNICTNVYKLTNGQPDMSNGSLSWYISTPGEYALVAGIGDWDSEYENFIYSRYAWTKIIVVSSDHKHIWEKRIDKNPTCTSVGKQSLYCRSCGSKQSGSTTDIPMTAHTWGQWTVTTAGKAVLTRTCAVCHTSQTQSFTPVLTLTANKLTMKTKQSTTKFKVTAMAAGDSLASVTSNNTKLLKVSNVNPNGTFKLKAQRKTGTAKLTITLKSGASKTIKVKIQKVKVKTTKVKVASKKLTLSKKQKYDLAPVISPVTSYDKLKCTTSNKKVATVSKKGLVTAKKKGKATITITSGKKKVKVKVTVR